MTREKSRKRTGGQRLGGRWGVVFLTAACAIGMALPQSVRAKDKNKDQDSKKMTKAERKREKAIRKEMISPYKKWLTQEVPYIITPEERAAFKKLTTDAEREQFIENFWERRNPNPGSPENAYKEEYYRRIAYANEHFSSGIPGWKTDRGRIYIMYGPPDEKETHPSGGTTVVDPNELPWMGSDMSSTMTTYPYEDWVYRYIPGIGENIKLEFVDPTMTGEYHLTMNPCEKDALANVPGDTTGCQGGVAIGPIFNPNEMLNPARYADNSNGMVTSTIMPASMDEFNQIDLYSKIFRPPDVKFNDLRAVVTSKITSQLLPFKVRTDFLKVTDSTVLTPITVEIPHREMQFVDKDGVMHAVLDIYGQITTIGGRVAQTFEDGVVADVPQHDFQSYSGQKSVYQKALYLTPGRYKLSVVVKDTQSGHMGSMEEGIVVPSFQGDKLSNSSLILANLIQPLPTSEVGSGPFVIGGTKVRPSVGQTFTPEQNLGIYMQVYNLGVDPKTHHPSADVNYQILKGGKAVLNQTESSNKIKDASEQLTIEKTMPAKLLSPGHYTLKITVTDNVNHTTDTQTTSFQVTG